jgi:hypothetical protein
MVAVRQHRPKAVWGGRTGQSDEGGRELLSCVHFGMDDWGKVRLNTNHDYCGRR